ncbi:MULTISPECIES: hypothetical protein [unclassified Mycolicibacterium]|uniref:hypothetical protein n=1 Tax=unclassified Mycolicibacterium TaxID=2636767 RepID=UPI001F4BDA26|nr:hypothetical protein [Mycolicibacterium sp. YH-1]UNB51890.1 hypothetical protein L0M16_29065 [Mycolicibacterium sp. YH-1]
MDRSLLARAWLITTGFALLGLLAGVVAAATLIGRESERFTAEATLAMLPSQQVPVTQAPGFWEVLSRGQATRSAAIVLADPKWLAAAAGAAAVPESDLSLEAGAIADTTLISVTVQANSVPSAQQVLDSVVQQAIVPAASASGPFRLEVVRSTVSATGSEPTRAQIFLALGFAGVLLGGGLGMLVSRTALRRGQSTNESGETARNSAPEGPAGQTSPR